MNEPRISSIMIHSHGSCGMETTFDENVSIDQYIIRFLSEATAYPEAFGASVWYMEKTVHNFDGTYKFDRNGRKKWKRIYINKQLSKRYFGI